MKKHILKMMEENETVTAGEIASSIGLSDRAIWKNIKQLRDAGIIERKDGDRGGYWKIIW